MNEFKKRFSSFENLIYRTWSKAIVEEARREFPKNLWVTKGVPDITPLKDWFEKWFGVE